MPDARIRAWLTEPMNREVSQSVERLARLDGVRQVAVMPDVHLGEAVCNGCVIATDGLVYPLAVGSDIGCGYTTLAFDANPDRFVDDDARARLRRGLAAITPILRHRAIPAAPPWPEGIAPGQLSSAALVRAAERDGRIELGSLGRGNHFLEVQRDDAGRLWVLIHSGSRAMGQAITRAHTAGLRRRCGLPAESACGRAYLNDAEWAVRYASASRRALLDGAARVLADEFGAVPDPTSLIDTSHNHLAIEDHGGGPLLVHRKSVNSAAPGQPNVVAGTMGTETYHVRGCGEPTSLGSCAHGAGRIMSRTEARRRIGRRDLERSLGDVSYDTRLADRLREEAPGAYKDIRAVMRAQRELVKIERTARPLLSLKTPRARRHAVTRRST